MNTNKKTKAVKANKAIGYIELNNNLQTSESTNNSNMSKKESDSFR